MDFGIRYSEIEMKELLDGARAQGALDCQRGKNPSENPYANDDPQLCRAWAEGYRDERLKFLRGQPL